MATRETVEKMYAFLAGCKPASDLARIDIEACMLALEPVPDDRLMEVAVMVSRTPGPYIPDTGTLFDMALDLMDDQPPVDEAWALVDRYRQPGGWRVGEKMVLPERVAEALREMGGDCGMWPEKDLAFRRKDFEQVYGRLRVREKREAALALPAGRLLTG